MKETIILGAGMAGFGAAYRLKQAKRSSIMFDKNGYRGGHSASFKHEGGWIFDDGPHVSFTKVERIKELFAESVHQEYEILQTYVDNYWRGHWIKHPAQCNLYGLPSELLVNILKDFVEASNKDHGPIRNYAEWLVASFGKTFAETFPMEYGHKYHTTTADNMTTDWLGPRLYRPSLDEVLRGALSAETKDVHYIDQFRYPTHDGFVSYLDMFLSDTELHLGQEVTRLDVGQRAITFSNGTLVEYDSLISSIPLPALIQLIPQAPVEVREAAARLACSKVLIVNLGVNREGVSKAHWSYFYDDDFVFTRLSFPGNLSRNTVPDGTSSIQAEIYFSDKYRPMTGIPADYIERTISDLKRCGLLRDEDQILFSEATMAHWAQVIFDHERKPALEVVHGYLQDVGIDYCGRFGDWGYMWTDESFISGERAAEQVLERKGEAVAS